MNNHKAVLYLKVLETAILQLIRKYIQRRQQHLAPELVGRQLLPRLKRRAGLGLHDGFIEHEWLTELLCMACVHVGGVVGSSIRVFAAVLYGVVVHWSVMRRAEGHAHCQGEVRG